MLKLNWKIQCLLHGHLGHLHIASLALVSVFSSCNKVKCFFCAKLLICIPKVIPAQHRLLWIEFVDIFWNAIHSALDRDGTIGLEEEGDDAATIVAVEGHDNEVEEKMLEMLDFLQALFLRLQITLYLHWNERSWYGFCG